MTGGPMQRLQRSAVERHMDGRPRGTTLEAALEGFEGFDTEPRHHITVLQTTSLEFAEDDNCVLMRGGGQWLLRVVPHVLRIRLIAPFEHRVKQWIKRTSEMTGETLNQRAAADLVRRDDVEKSGRIRYLYEGDIR